VIKMKNVQLGWSFGDFQGAPGPVDLDLLRAATRRLGWHARTGWIWRIINSAAAPCYVIFRLGGRRFMIDPARAGMP
jgi:hypothetical protein